MGVRVWLSIALLAVVSVSQAADEQNRFAIEGVGLLTCTEYLSARQERSPLYHQFGGWMNGYLTGMNRYAGDTFDMTPWQSNGMLTHWLAELCEKNPDLAFVRAVTALANKLSERRMQAHSPLLTLDEGEQGTTIYSAVLRQAQARLVALGYPDVLENGGFDQATRDALTRYQQEQDLPVTGLPDPMTLSKLLQ